MREYSFEIAGRNFILSEGPDLKINGRPLTEWEVREVCEDSFGHEYYHQLASARIRRRATEAEIRQHITARVLASDEDDDEDTWAA